MLTQEDYKNILALIAKAQITGADAVVVAILVQKINKLLAPQKDEPKEPKTK